MADGCAKSAEARIRTARAARENFREEAREAARRPERKRLYKKAKAIEILQDRGFTDVRLKQSRASGVPVSVDCLQHHNNQQHDHFNGSTFLETKTETATLASSRDAENASASNCTRTFLTLR